MDVSSESSEFVVTSGFALSSRVMSSRSMDCTELLNSSAYIALQTSNKGITYVKILVVIGILK